MDTILGILLMADKLSGVSVSWYFSLRSILYLQLAHFPPFRYPAYCGRNIWPQSALPELEVGKMGVLPPLLNAHSYEHIYLATILYGIWLVIRCHFVVSFFSWCWLESIYAALPGCLFIYNFISVFFYSFLSGWTLLHSCFVECDQ